jgi:hypothetical protein
MHVVPGDALAIGKGIMIVLEDFIILLLFWCQEMLSKKTNYFASNQFKQSLRIIEFSGV